VVERAELVCERQRQAKPEQLECGERRQCSRPGEDRNMQEKITHLLLSNRFTPAADLSTGFR